MTDTDNNLKPRPDKPIPKRQRTDAQRQWEREWRQRPDVKERRKQSVAKYQKNLSPEKREVLRERKNAHMAEYRQRPEVIERNRQWWRTYRSNPETASRLNAYSAEYRRKPEMMEKERVRSLKKERVRLALQANAEGTHSADEFDKMCELGGHRCVRCNELVALTVDHIVPLSKGGCNCIHNLQPLCGRCNSGKRNHHATDYRTPEILAWLATLAHVHTNEDRACQITYC